MKSDSWETDGDVAGAPVSEVKGWCLRLSLSNPVVIIVRLEQQHVETSLSLDLCGSQSRGQATHKGHGAFTVLIESNCSYKLEYFFCEYLTETLGLKSTKGGAAENICEPLFCSVTGFSLHECPLHCPVRPNLKNWPTQRPTSPHFEPTEDFIGIFIDVESFLFLFGAAVTLFSPWCWQARPSPQSDLSAWTLLQVLVFKHLVKTVNVPGCTWQNPFLSAPIIPLFADTCAPLRTQEKQRCQASMQYLQLPLMVIAATGLIIFLLIWLYSSSWSCDLDFRSEMFMFLCFIWVDSEKVKCWK